MSSNLVLSGGVRILAVTGACASVSLVAIGPAARAQEAPVPVPAVSVTATPASDGSAAVGYKPDTAQSTGLWGTLPIQDTPYSINVVSQDEIDNRIVSTTDQLFEDDPLVQLNLNQSRGYGSIVYIRGIRLDSGFTELNGLRVTGDLIMPVEDKERAEIFAGLSGFLYGPGNAGGLVNYVTKRPTADNFEEVTLGDYGGGQAFGHVDLGGTTGPDGKIGYRFNLSGSDGDTAIDNNNVERLLVSLALDFHITDDLLVQVDYSHQHYYERGTQADWGSFGGDFPHFAANILDPSKNYSQEWAFNQNEMDVAGTNLTYAFTPNLHLRMAYQYVGIEDENVYTGNNVSYANGVYTYNLTAVRNAPQSHINNSGYAFLDYSFEIASITNKVTAGYYIDSYELDAHQDETAFDFFPQTFAVGPNPIYVAAPLFTNGSLPTYTAQVTTNGNWVIGDEITVNEQWSVLVGINRTEIETTDYNTDSSIADHYDQAAVTPSASVLFKPLPWLTTYATYIESLENGGSAATSFNNVAVTNGNQTLAPTTSTQYEIGAKATVGGMLLTAALFDIDRANSYYAPNAGGTSYTYTNDGEQDNKGLELTVAGKVTPELTLVGGMTWLDAKVTKTNTAYLQGASPYGTAKRLGKLYAEYAVPAVPGLTLTGGVDYVGNQLANAFAYPNPTAQEWLPSYTTGDIGARYETRLYGTDMIFRFDVTNVSDESYWQQAEVTGMPRTFAFSRDGKVLIMGREIAVNGIFLHAYATTCFHICRYCQLRTPKAIPADFKRYAALVDRFIDWKEATGRTDFTVAEWYGNSHDYGRDVQEGVRRLSARQGDPIRVVLLGGTVHRPMAEMRHWLEERQSVGIDTVVASFPGRAERHDYWNGKKGNYRFQLDTLHLAAEMGMRLQQRLFLIRDTIAEFETLLDDLDAIPTHDFERWSYPLFYSGLARRLEAERLTGQELEALPARVKATFRDDHAEWRSERGWIDHVGAGLAPDPEPVPLAMQIDAESLAWAEERSCDEIVETLAARSRAAYAAMPSRLEAYCERYADPANDKVYMFLGQMEHVWLDRYLAENQANFDIRATCFG